MRVPVPALSLAGQRLQEIAFGRDFQAPSFDIAFYGDLFLTSTDQGIRVNESGVNSDAPIKGAEAARALDDSVPVDPRELEFLEAAAAAAEQGRPWVEPTSEANASRYRPVSGTGGGGRLWSMM